MKDVAGRLRANGMSDLEVQGKVRLLALCADALPPMPGSTAEPYAFFVPGRIEVLGKHTDYAGGRSLLCAMERGIVALAVPRSDDLVRVVDARLGETREQSLGAPHDVVGGDWATYLATLVRRLSRDFPAARRGADIAFASDLPAASGMSSSSALIIALYLALEAVNNLANDDDYRRVITSTETLAGYLGAVENGRSFGPLAAHQGVGTLGGNQDQTAILCCEARTLTQYSFCPVRLERKIPLPSDLRFAIAYSGVAAQKTSSALRRYNEAAEAVACIVSEWNAATQRSDVSLGDAIASGPRAAEQIRAMLAGSRPMAFTKQRLLDRFEQFVAETQAIIPPASEAFAQDDRNAIGELVDRSQHEAERRLGNQVPETIALPRLARALGAHAASAFGAGFGGSVWALVSVSHAGEFLDAWQDAYRLAFPAAGMRSEFFITTAGPGAFRL